MATTTLDGYTKKDVRMSEMLKALAHPARIAIVRLLARKNSCVCGEIVDQLPLAQATVSQHLKALKEVGIIQGDLEGSSTCYCLNKKTIEELDVLFDSFINKIAPERCC